MSLPPYRLQDAIRVGSGNQMETGEVVTVRTKRTEQILGVRLPDGGVISMTVPLSPIPNLQFLALSGAIKAR